MILIAFILVFIIDISGFITSLKKAISYLLTKGRIVKDNYSLKPFDCSLCMTFWVGCIYYLVIGDFTLLNLAYICLCSFLTPSIKDILYSLQDILTKLLQKWTD